MHESQWQAKDFIATRVVDEAMADGTPLTDDEREMLYWSESDPDYKADPQLPVRLASFISDDKYEAKVRGLLRHAFRADVAADPAARHRWQRASAALQRGDHYLGIMVEQALGPRLQARSWKRVWGLRAVPAALVLMVLAGGLAVGVKSLTGYDLPARGGGLALLAAFAVVYGLARAAFGKDVVGRFARRVADWLLPR